jgi:hypothetical protein
MPGLVGLLEDIVAAIICGIDLFAFTLLGMEWAENAVYRIRSTEYCTGRVVVT